MLNKFTTMMSNFLPQKRKGAVITPPMPVHTVNTSNGPRYVTMPQSVKK